MLINPNNLSPRDRYKLTIGTVLPRPIAWVSSMDGQGRHNLAPFSYFNAVCATPLVLMFAVGLPDSGEKKDTLRNIEETREFVINLPNEETAEQMNLSATALPHGESEFEWAGVTPEPSQTIRVPRVAEAPVAFECTLNQIVTINDQPGGGSAIFGEVKHIYIRDDIYVDSYVLLDVLKPIGRLSGDSYTRTSDRFDLKRVPLPSQNQK